MITKTETLKTDLPKIQPTYCEKCDQHTPHKVVASHETVTVFTEPDENTKETLVIDVGTDAMQIVRCERCETVSFRKMQSIRGFHQESSKGIWVDPVYEMLYIPDHATRRLLDVDDASEFFD